MQASLQESLNSTRNYIHRVSGPFTSNIFNRIRQKCSKHMERSDVKIFSGLNCRIFYVCVMDGSILDFLGSNPVLLRTYVSIGSAKDPVLILLYIIHISDKYKHTIQIQYKHATKDSSVFLCHFSSALSQHIN